MAKIERKDVIIATCLALAMFITLFLAVYFNASSGETVNPSGKTLEDKYYLSGPDPYYNMRVVEKLYETGHYPYWNIHDPDPLLNYPVGKANSRPPLFNTLFVILAKVLSSFMSSVDAIGLSMQFLPSLYGALLVIPVYFIGTLLFGRKAGLIAALLVPLIPIHIGSGHGSAYSLADHDSFILLLGTTLYFFVLRSLNEENFKKSIIFASMAGVFLGMEALSWAGAYFYFAFLALYFVIQMIVDIVRYRASTQRFLIALSCMGIGLLLAVPSYLAKGSFNYMSIMSFAAVFLFGLIYLFLSRKKLPWIITLPSIATLAGIALFILYMIKDTTNPLLYPLSRFANHIFGGLAYVQKSKTYLTIAEASTFGISRTVMSFGPALYLMAWFAFIFLIIWKRFIKKWDAVSIFIMTWFIVENYLTGSAGRFLNDLVPIVAILSGGIIWYLTEKLDIKQMRKTIANISSLRDIRKAIRASHIAFVVFVTFIIIVPNTFLSLDAAVPSMEKQKIFGKGYQGAFGLSLHTEKYWEDAFRWLRAQDKSEREEKRPAFISWWDYGFYCAAMAKHPTVADNFQSGIEAAGNFHTSESEKEAISVLIIRLVEGDMSRHNGKISKKVREVFDKYLGNNSTKLIDIFEDPIHHRNTTESSYGKIIGEEYGGKKYRVRKVNAMYHDATSFLTDHLDEDEIIMLYRDLQIATGWQIRYYGVEGYDVNIFNVFTFLSDKGVFGYETTNDRYFKLYYKDKYGKTHTPEEVRNLSKELSREDFLELELRPFIKRKNPFYNSMVYKVYLGYVPRNLFDLAANRSISFAIIPFLSDNSTDPFGPGNYYYQPTAGLKHFVVKYISPFNLTKSLFFHRGDLCFGMPAVVIAKFYEGAILNGTITCMGKPMRSLLVVVKDDYKQVIQTKLTTGRIVNRTIEKIPHDRTTTDNEGKFRLIAPAGNITLSIEVLGEMYNRYTLKTITFNSSTDPSFYPISEAEATRRPGVDYNRTINITIEPASLEGVAFNDTNGNGTYDEGIDEPLSDVTIKLVDTMNNREYALKTDSAGRYNISNIFPGIYSITAEYEGFEIHNNSALFLKEGDNYYNIRKPTPANVHGIVFFDKDGNGSYDKGEELVGANISIVYTKTNLTVSTTVTNETGYYEFRGMTPGEYEIKAVYINESTGYPQYSKDITFYLAENETMVQNISMTYAKVKVSGYTLYNNTPLDNVTIQFTPIGNNTSPLFVTTESRADGYYEVSLVPGEYNVTASKDVYDNETNVTIHYYSEPMILKIAPAQAPITNYNITLVARIEESSR